ncbi:ADP-ribose 1 -phosphate phosphatase [Lecanosticta acicola]|uniref:ADP-ribose 1''-phosphate phosphatase n=1 Tax=Lecanosticta acicola TaxID=111012 RepID=A0AAI8YVS7_9PEZI|nr:ADP-ribose 1 -phosphate phosphatase [Lecanosticta acicola]
MTRQGAHSGTKRRADLVDTQPDSGVKRARPNSIMDYMKKPKPQHQARKDQEPSKEAVLSESTSHEQKETSATENDGVSEPQANNQPKNTSSATETEDTPGIQLRLIESIGDIFDAPPNSLIIHACNCEGSWGAGIAAAFKNHYAGAYKVYAAHCKQNGHDLFRKALLIPPQKLDKKKQHFVGCLFTSRSKGKKKDSPSAILQATKPAMEDLLRQVQDWNAEHADGDAVGEVRICKINSGLFAVPWEETKEVMESLDVENHSIKEVKVISREE